VPCRHWPSLGFTPAGCSLCRSTRYHSRTPPQPCSRHCHPRPSKCHGPSTVSQRRRPLAPTHAERPARGSCSHRSSCSRAFMDEGALSFVTAMRYPIGILRTNEKWRGRMPKGPRPSGPVATQRGVRRVRARAPQHRARRPPRSRRPHERGLQILVVQH
jgi:hypothetical protein